jgi:cbb3-type cytochrome oxidase subunit 3
MESNYKAKFILTFFLLCSIGLFNISLVQAGNLGDAFKKNLEDVAGPSGAGYKADAAPEAIIGSIVQVALSFLGVIFLVLMVYGGFLWMTARGNEEQVAKAKNLITAAIIGLIIVLAAYAISYVLIEKIGTKTLEKP